MNRQNVTAPKRIQRRRTKGWRMPEGAVYVGRPSRYGNPFIIGGWYKKGDHGGHSGPFQMVFTRAMEGYQDSRYTRIETAEQALEWYRWYLEVTNWKFFDDLRGKDLACWCKVGDLCHADVLLEIANREASK